MRQQSISTFFPAYNEAQNLSALIASADDILAKNFSEYEIIVINDGSTDDSLQILENLRHLYPHLHIITHPTNLGYGAAVKSGFLAAKNGLVFFSDADQQFDLKELKLLLDKLYGYDAAIGYRAPRRDDYKRLFAAWCWNRLVTMTFGLSCKDVDCAFKLMRRSILDRIDPTTLISEGSMISAELLFRLKQAGAKIAEVPVTHFSRKSGDATGLKPLVVLRAFKEFYKFWKLTRGRKI